jgi:excisionase family DNA binding protein
MTAATLMVVADDETARQLSRYVRHAVLVELEYLRHHGLEIPPALAAIEVITSGRPLTLDQAARHAGVSVRTIARWRDAGLPSTGQGQRVRIARDDLDEYVGQLRTSA